MLKRDFLLAQINKFSELIFAILFNIENNDLTAAETLVQENYSGSVLDDFITTGELPEDNLAYENLLFQLELLYTKIRIDKAKGLDIKGLKEKYLKVAKMVLNRQKDFNLFLQQRIAEAQAISG